MGCISSKMVMARTSSQRDEQGPIRRRPLLNRLLIGTATPASHHLVALSKLHQDTNHTIDALELMAPDPPSPQHDMLVANSQDVDANGKEHGRRSKSYQWSPVDHTLLDSSYKFHMEDKGNTGRCRSFHTVEEYDALIQKICPAPKDDGELLQVPNTNFNQVTRDLEGDEMKSKIKHDETIREDDNRGIRTKKAREMGSNYHNDDIEFETVGSLRQWLDVRVYSPRAATDYATPRFGSYNNTQAPVEDSVLVETEEDASVIVVDPELVAEFDEYMQRLQVEENNILKQIEANLHVHNSQTTWNGHA